jgi:hypothetical protein
MKILVIGSLAALLALQIGCQKTDPPAPAPTTVSAPTEAASTATVADVPTQEDYEAAAEKAIPPAATPGVLTQELDKLEKEIGQ